MSAGHSPLDQFKVEPLVRMPEFFGIDASITNSALFMILAVVAITLLFAYALRKRATVPSRSQSFAEITYQFVETVVVENGGHDGKKYFPFFLTLFLFIAFMNLLGLLPHSFTPTSHIIVTFGMGAFVFLGITLLAFIKKGPIGFFKHFIPEGLPIAVIPVIFVIEIISYLARPISLSLRLAANMIAGHTLLKVIAGFVLPLGLLGVVPGLLPLGFLVVLYGIEFFVCILQAYVFTLLCSIYLGEALADHH